MTVLSVFPGKRNGPLIAEAARLWIKPDDLVLDVTYGRGLFWTEYRPERLVTHDLANDGVDFRQLPEADRSVDVVVFDPPYISTGTRSKSTVDDMYQRYGLGEVKGYAALFEIIAAGLKECARVLAPKGRLFAKCMDYVESGKLRLGHHLVVSTCLDLGLEQVDEFIHYSGTGPQPTLNLDGSPRRQVHSRRAHSFLCVFQDSDRAIASLREEK